MAGVAARHRQVRYQSRTHAPLLAFFSATWGATCERKARTLKLRGVLTVMTQPTPGDQRGSGAPLDVRRASPNSSEEAGPPSCGATKHQGADLNQPRHRSRAGRIDHLERGGRALGLRLVRRAPRRGGKVRDGALHGRGARGQPLFQSDDLLAELGGELHLQPYVVEGVYCMQEATALCRQ